MSCKSVPQVSWKSVPQEHRVRVTHKSVPEECPTRVSYKSVLYVAFRTCLHSGSWAPSCSFCFLPFGCVDFAFSFAAFSRERLRRVLRKKTSAELRLIYIFTSSPLHIHILTYISAHLHIYIHNCTSTSLHIFTSSHQHLRSSSSSFTSAHIHLCSSSHPHIYISHLHLSLFLTFSLKAGGSAAGSPGNAALRGDRACRVREMQARVRFGFVAGNPLRGSRVSSARNAGQSAFWIWRGQPSAGIARVECAKAGESAFWIWRGQPSAEIAHVECAKRRRECVLDLARATLCGDRACRAREMQARARFVSVRRNPLRRSCASSARNAGESAIWVCPAQPSAEIARVERAKCWRQGDESHARAYLKSWKMRTGEVIVQL